jgi:hypothetical protein
LATLSLAGPSVRFTAQAAKRSLEKLRQAAKTVADNLQSSTVTLPLGEQAAWGARKSVGAQAGAER